MLRASTIATLLLLVSIACQASKEPPAPPPTGGLRTQAIVLYCGPQQISVQLLSDTRVRVTVAEGTFELDRVPSASGTKYEVPDDPTTYYWSKGDRGLLQIRGEAYPECGRVKTGDNGFRARGNEPGWQLIIDESGMTLEADYGETHMVLPEFEQEFTESGRRYLANADGRTLTVSVTDEVCADDMTGMPYPRRVMVELNDRTLHGCGGNPAELLEGAEWIVEDIDRRGIIDSSHMSLRFAAGQLSGHAGCNGYTTSYVLSGEGLRVEPATATEKACAESLLRQEDRFLTALSKVSRFTIDPTGALVLHTQDGGSILARR